jgi:hypothetical protein
MRALSISTSSTRRTIRLRGGTRSRQAPGSFGHALAALALLLQIALPGPHAVELSASRGSAGEITYAFDEHALCRVRGVGAADTPVDRAPTPVRHEFAACCLWHVNIGLALAPSATLERIGFARSDSVFTLPEQIAPRRYTGTVGARAPPTRA